jgi:ATP-binding cassette subfamily F protein uup
MPLVQIENLSLAYGPAPLLDNLTLRIEKGERICLLGRNGAGKTSLLGLIEGRITPDRGRVVMPAWVRIGHLPQEVPADLGGTVLEVVCQSSEAAEKSGGEVRVSAETILSRLDVDPDLVFTSLSAGLRRQVMLARALCLDPDLLLLDEPTNHLDVPAIEKLEQLILRSRAAVLFITHDRRFLQALATRIVELDRGTVASYSCGYEAYLQRKSAAEANEDRGNALFDRKLAEEERWIRRGLKARRTRNEGRVRALETMRRTRGQRRNRAGTVNMEAQEAEASGKRVIEARRISFTWPGGGHPVVNNFSTTILRGEKIGLIGPNGVGKTTLIKLLVKELSPDLGDIRHGTRLETVYFDQLRSQLDGERSVAENIGDGKEFIEINGRKRHVLSYLKAFLFSAERARSPVRILSGGERNRLLLARLFTRAFNLLVLDEPTNDLDLETLELLEQLLLAFTGTLLLVSHDRQFLDNVVTRSFAFEGCGNITQVTGGYAAWRRRPPSSPAKKPAEGALGVRPNRDQRKKATRLGYLQQRELKSLPDRIEALERERDHLFARMSDPDFYRQGGKPVATAQQRAAELETELEAAYSRWEELEAQNSG